MGKYNKLIAAIVGNLLGVALVWAAFKFPGIVSCQIEGDPSTCTVLSFTYTQLQAAVMLVVNGVLVERWAANTA